MSKALAEAAQRRAPMGLMSFLDNGTIVFANAQLHAWLGVEEGELVHRAVDKLMSPASRVFHSTHFFPLLKLHGKADEIHFVLRDSAGNDVPVLISATRDTGEGGEGVSHCAVMLNAQRKEFEARLVEARKVAEAAAVARDHFLAMVSHELRTPLSAVLGWVKLLQAGTLDEAKASRAFDIIERNAKAQSVLIEDLLDVSRIVSGKLRLSPKPLEPAAVVEMAVDTIRPAAQAKGIEILCALDRSAGIVHADPDRLQQIVWNLTANAVKFTPKGGRVQVRLWREHSRACIEVSDTGAGIDPEQLPFLFDRFWQAPSGLSHERSGLGLGLAISRSLVELHGGTIGAHSEGAGQGSAFTVQLPLAIAASARVLALTPPALDEAPEANVLAGLRVLVVDDDEDARGMMKMLLESAGALVVLASQADEALASLEELDCHILLTDIGLQGKDGIELIRALRAGAVCGARALPAVAVTGRSRPQDRVMLLRAGFQGYLSKPVEPAEVVAMIRALVA